MRDILLSQTYQENVVGLAVDESQCIKKWYVFDSRQRVKHIIHGIIIHIHVCNHVEIGICI